MLQELQLITQKCGDLIMPYFGNVDYKFKNDKSPLSDADKISHTYLVKHLKKLKDITIVSEENISHLCSYSRTKTFWLIDPIDGTKEFINNIPEFCISIALIDCNKPILGCIYAPVTKEFFFAEQQKGCYTNSKYVPVIGDKVIAGISHYHCSAQTIDFLKCNNITNVKKIGSALKFVKLALNEIQVYPRYEGSKEWDIAAGHIILKEAGGNIIDLKTKTEMSYNEISMENNYFIAYNKYIDINHFNLKDF